MKGRLARLLLLLAAVLPLPARTLSFDVAGFASLYDAPVPVAIEWDEAWLDGEPATTYNHRLALAACMLSQLSYGDIAAAYRTFGVAEGDYELHYDIDYGDPVWGNDQCAFSFASRPFGSPQGERTLLFIVIRGTPEGENEWLSNLNINDGERENTLAHRGFARAEEQVRQALAAYLLAKRIDTARTSVLMAGHSRGGAVANLLAAEFVHTGLFDTGRVYAYTFSAPNVTALPGTDSGEYGFIWNLVNAEDIISAFPFYDGRWRFRKYGNTLTLANAWNTEPELYEKDYLPRMNRFYRMLVGRDYAPFRAGPFIQSQLAETARALAGDVARYYSGSPSLYSLVLRLCTSLDASPPQEGKESFAVRLINRGTGGLYDYLLTALADMHANETYLCWLLALGGDELFSSLGCGKLIVEGMEDGAVFDEDGSVLATVSDGRVSYASLHAPLLAFQSAPNRTVIGIPWNRRLTVMLCHKSLFPAAVTVTEQRLTGYGAVVETGEPQTVRISRGEPFLYSPRGGGFRPQEGYRPAEPVRLHPVVTADSEGDVRAGFLLGGSPLYAVLLAGTRGSGSGRSWEIAPGAGTQLTLVSPLCLDLEAFARLRWQAEDGGHGFFLIPSLHASLTFRPTRRFSLSAGAGFDLILPALNGGYLEACSPQWRLDAGGGVHVLPRLVFGVRF